MPQEKTFVRFVRPGVREPETMARAGTKAAAAALEELRERAAGCRNCDLWRLGTQTVFGEGPPGAPMMLVGEQPGDQEDLAGRPFVGPAGRLLDESLDQAGMRRSRPTTACRGSGAYRALST